MKNDVVIPEKGKNDNGYELYGVSKDYYNGLIKIHGYIKEKSLDKMLKMYKDWRMILLRIPTTKNGVYSMKLAIEKGFNIVGYDIGFNNMNWTFIDSVMLAYYPNGGSQVFEVNYLEENKPLFNKVREIFFSRVN